MEQVPKFASVGTVVVVQRLELVWGYFRIKELKLFHIISFNVQHH